MGRRKRTNFGVSAYRNNKQYLAYFERLKDIAISMFEWKNLPPEIDERYLELILFEQGSALFFKNDAGDFATLRFSNQGKLDIYNRPIKRRAYANNGYNGTFDASNSVIIYNNYLHTNTVPLIENYAMRLWDLDRTIDVNARAQKTPILIVCKENERLTVQNLYKEYDGNSPVIYADKGLDPNSLKVLKTDAPYIGDKIYSLRTQIWNEALTYLGISSTNTQKKERLISDEVLRQNGGTVASRYSRLNARKQACKAINEMFGLNIDVEFREDFVIPEDMKPTDGEVGDTDE